MKGWTSPGRPSRLGRKDVLQVARVEGNLVGITFDFRVDLAIVVSISSARALIVIWPGWPASPRAIWRRMMPLPSRAKIAAMRVSRLNSSTLTTTSVLYSAG